MEYQLEQLKVDSPYSKKDLYEIFNVPKAKQKGAWDTGYREYNGIIFIFCNVGIPGRTGHDYNNFWDGNLFSWQAKNNSSISQPIINKMVAGNIPVLLFTRITNREAFIYEGEITPMNVSSGPPVNIVWQLKIDVINNIEPQLAQKNLTEGQVSRVLINKYERNPIARRLCIEHYGGPVCQCCGLNFLDMYGEMGRNFIHVHHIIPISMRVGRYELNPLTDLIPVCPNCHSMLHTQNPPISFISLKEIITSKRVD